MNCDRTDPVDGVDRRSVLAAGAAGLSLSLSGCIDTVRSVVTGDGNEQLSLSIATVPGDYDQESLRIARHLETNLQTVGVDANITPRDPSDFLEMVLIDRDFDLYVGRHPAAYDPDFLYEALHSSFSKEAGWQNPFGTHWFDRDLDRQRHTDGEERKTALTHLLEAVAADKPFDPICRPTENRIYRTDQFEGWGDGHFATRAGYLGVEPAEDDVERLTALVTDSRPSTNVNPLSATNRDRETIVDLIYDSLGTLVYEDDDVVIEPWLADGWETTTDGDRTTITVSLREHCLFHDHEEHEGDDRYVTAYDVAFTYRLLDDTAFGRTSVPSPAPRYRGPVSAIDEIEIEDEYTLRLTVDGNTAVAARALTVPILPRHVWTEAFNDRVRGVDDFSPQQGQWGLVTSSSIDLTGSGPYAFADQSTRDHLTLERFDDHFTVEADDEDLPEPGVEELRFSVDPGSTTSISRVESGNADLTSSMLGAHSLAEIPDDNDDLERSELPSWLFYLVGFNVRREPCSDEDFRRAVTQLIDKTWIVDEIFEDHAEPLATPVTDEWVPDSPTDLEWNGEDPETPFVGDDGELGEDGVDRARRAFEAAYYPIDSGGRVLERGSDAN